MSAPELVRAIAAERLPGSRLPLATEPLSSSAWSALISGVTNQRLVGMLGSAIATGRFPVTADQRAHVAALDAAQASVAVLLDRALLDVADQLDGAGIPFRVLKGAALAHTAYPDPDLRSYGDVDLLVASDHLDASLDVLVGSGARRRFPEPRPGFLRRFGKGVSVIRPDGLEIDVHRTLVAGPYGLSVDLPGLFASAIPFQIGGRTLIGLGSTERFLHACYHAVLGSDPPRVLALRDVAQLALDDHLDLHKVVDTAQAWRATAVVALAVQQAWRDLAIADCVAVSSWAANYSPSSRDRRQLAVYRRDDGRRYPRQAVATLWSLPRLSDRLAYARAMLLPTRTYLRERDGTYVSRLRRGISVLREVEAGR